MNEHISTSSYDDIAPMYHRLWADWYLPAALPALEALFFDHLAPGACVLDVCCGSGHVTRELVRRGYSVTGVDNSAALIAIARAELSQATFSVQDVRVLRFENEFQAALSTFDSLNHILDIEGLRKAFASVYRALQCGGRFVLDMNLHEAYLSDLREWSVDLSETSVGLVRGRFDLQSNRAETDLIWFTREGDSACWRQQRSTVEQQCYSQAEILESLRMAGFTELESIPATQAGVAAELGLGRMYFVARKLC